MAYLNFDKTQLINLEYSLKRELISTNRAGAYSSSTLIGCNTRKYHGLLVCPIEEFDGGRHVLLSTLDTTVIQHDQSFNLGIHKYAGDNFEPKGHKYLRDFTSDPSPKLLYRVGGVILSKQTIFIQNEHRLLIKYTLEEANSPTTLQFKPFLAFRNIHALSKSNMDVNHKFNEIDNGISSCLYQGYPDLHLQFSKQPEFVPTPNWHHDVEYIREQERGYEYKEDLYVPGYFELPIKKGESIVFSAGLKETVSKGLKHKFTAEIKTRVPRDSYNNCLSNASSQFFMNEGKDTFIYAGYPWLPVRSRDMLISLVGFTLPNDDKKTFKKVIDSIVRHKQNHLIQDDHRRSTPTSFSSDNSLWFIWALQQYAKTYSNEETWKLFKKPLKEIFNGYLKESELFTLENNGLLYVNPTDNATSWMNASIDNKACLNRHGYLIEGNALWYNALKFIAEISEDKAMTETAAKIALQVEQSFEGIFFNEELEQFADYVTHHEKNMQVRPNQLLAYALAYSPISKDKGQLIIQSINNQLVTPVGLRSLSPADSQYAPKYLGDHNQREMAAFNGSVWPWLMTFYYEANHKIQAKRAKRLAKTFLKSIEPEIQIHGLCSISELFHGDPPHEAKGTVSFAKNTGELQRLNWLLTFNKKKQ